MSKLENKLKVGDLDKEEEENNSEEIDIMSMLEKEKLFIIEKDFHKKEKGLELKEFVKVMLKHLNYSAQYQENDRGGDKKKPSMTDEEMKQDITLRLIDLFKEIDVNGDETMEWEEFSNHIIELGLLRKDRTFRNVIKKYNPSENVIDKEKHETEIEKVYYFEKIKNLIVLEKDSPKFKVYSSNNCELLCEVNAHKGTVLASEYLTSQNLIATSSNDLTINFWDTSTFNLKQILSTPEIQLCIRYAEWNPTCQMLYSGGSDAIIHYYDGNLKEKGTMSGWNPFFKKDIQQFGHAGPIGDILPINTASQQIVVTAGLDGKICLWDVPTHSFKKELQGHDKGVYSLDWSSYREMHQCLLSAGLDHEAFVWNTYVKERIFLLRGHNHPLIGVKCLPNSPQIITADISGMVKIWDVRKFLCMQTFNVPMDELNSFCLTYPKKRILAAGKHLAFFEYDEPKDQYLTDEKMCLKVLYDKVLFCFITLHPDSIKVWNAKTGKLTSVHRELSQNDLTVCILDSRQRKLFVGDSEGKIFTVNVKNGAKMKKFERHNKMITDLGYWTSVSLNKQEKEKSNGRGMRRLISASGEEIVKVHDEDSIDPHKSCRYRMLQHKGAVNTIAIKKKTEIVASGSDDGTIVITDLVSYKQEIIPHKNKIEVKKVIFLDPHDCLCATDGQGNVSFYAVHNSKKKNNEILSKGYITKSVSKVDEKFPVTAVAFNSKLKYLILGDEFGNIVVWDLTIMLEILDEHQNDDKKNKSKKPLSYQSNHKTDDHSINMYGKAIFPTEIDNEGFKSKANVNKKQIREFSESDIVEVGQIRKAHSDGITWIEVIKKYGAFATSSFDCCCHIWSFNDLEKKIGSLILGFMDKNWNFQVDEMKFKEDNMKEANQLLKDVENLKYDNMFLEKDDKDVPKKNISNTQKFLDAIHSKNFTKKEEHSKLSDDEEEDKELTYQEKVLKKARKVINIHNMLKGKSEIDKKEKEEKEENDKYMGSLRGYRNFGGKKKEGILDCKNYELDWGTGEKTIFNDMFLDQNDEDENNYNILTDLNDYGRSSQTNIGFTSKNAFKTKLLSKNHIKVKLK